MRLTKAAIIRFCTVAIGAAAIIGTAPSQAQDPHPGQPGYVSAGHEQKAVAQHRGSTGIDVPEKSDTLFLVDVAPGLDTGCVFNDRSPLVFDIPVDRVVGDVTTLVSKGLLSATVELTMPAYDVDFDAIPGNGNAPERDRVVFNGHVVPGEFLRGSNNAWHKNTFRIPVEWVRFPREPQSANAGVTPEPNRVEVHIDVQNSTRIWCTEIDWASLKLEKAVRPVVGVHGILSNGGIWDSLWVPGLRDLGVPMSHLNMGALDSIESNASKIANHVERIKRHYGVDKVNIVAHSKGGLDSRQFAESDGSVEKILQLGTPNAGSPWADIVQAGSLALPLPPGNLLINALASPAGRQLTVVYMRGYNRSHLLQQNVEYTSVAGHYDAACLPGVLFCQILNLFTYLPTLGPSDGIVPVWSAHALDMPCEPTFSSSGFNIDALHIRLHASAPLFNRYRQRLFPGSTACPQARSASTEPPPAITTGSVSGEIPAGQTRTHTIPIDQSVPTLFTLLYPSDTLGLTLISPSGRRIDPAVAATDPDIVYEAGDIIGGRAAIYALPNPETGIWTVEIAAGALTSPLPYMAQAQLRGPDLVLAGPADNTATSIGGQVTLTATLKDAGQAVAGAVVKARIGRPDGSVADFVLRDDGVAPDTAANDGVYNVRVAGHKFAGLQPVAFSASGQRANGAPFSREVFHLLSVSAGQSSFTGTFSDAGEDSDGDGLFNHLAVNAEVDAGVAGNYRLYGELSDQHGNLHKAVQVVALPSGRSTIRLRFGGEAIFDSGIDGPYTVTALRLSEETSEGNLPAAELAAPFQTQAYRYAAFQHRPIRASGNSSATGIDSDGDRLFDLLEVSVEIAVDNAGLYQWSGVLVDGNGNELGFVSGSGTLVAGRNFIAFRFNALPIGQAGVDGPYYLRDVLILGGGANAIIDQTFATPPFRANEFEGYRGTPTVVTPVPLGPFTGLLIGLTLLGFGLRRLRREGSAALD